MLAEALTLASSGMNAEAKVFKTQRHIHDGMWPFFVRCMLILTFVSSIAFVMF